MFARPYRRHRRMPRSCAAGCIAVLAFSAVTGATAPIVPPLIGPDGQLSPTWHLMTLPTPGVPATRFEVAEIDGRRAVRITAERSYGNLVHPIAAGDTPTELRWDWRLESPNAAADLRWRRSDDAALKVCAFFDLPLSAMPFIERQLLKLARLRSGLDLPAATLCYVWDNRLPVGTVLDNAFSRRVRYLILQSGEQGSPRWVTEQRMLKEDFARVFGAESRTMPRLTGIGIGADADNTRGRSTGDIADLALERTAADGALRMPRR
jgi:hypothetical protein